MNTYKIYLYGPTAADSIFPERKTLTARAATADRAMELATQKAGAGWKIEKVTQYYPGTKRFHFGAAWLEIL